MPRENRPNNQLRPIKITRNFTKAPAGSVLWQQGDTLVLCTASISKDVPPWFRNEQRAGGWITADYVMLPGSTPGRKPWPKIGHTDGRGTEIQRLIGRSLRAAIDLSKIGPHTISLDCQVLQADGGTRTAAICGAYIALVDAIRKLPENKPELPEWAGYDPNRAIVSQISAVSVGLIDGEIRLDLDYKDDVKASVDLNVAMADPDKFVEIQGTGENGGALSRKQLSDMLDLAVLGCEEIMGLQDEALKPRL